MLRSIARGSLQALAYCHEQGVVHGALGSGSVMLSTFDDRSAARLVVKLDNFGFARRVTLPKAPSSRGSSSQGASDPPAAASQPASLATDDTPLALGQREDLRALAVVLLECILSALAFSGPSQLTSAESIQRLLGEVFSWGVDEFRQYCEDEPDWAAAVELLSQDNGAGWALLQDLATGGRSAAELAASRFCEL
jgi:serine/threonine protein kinase